MTFGSDLTAPAAILFGGLHALEPGHGKTALYAFLATGQRSWKEGFIISVLAASTHTFIIFILASASYSLVRNQNVVANELLFSRVSSALIIILGLFVIFRTYRANCNCGLEVHEKPLPAKSKVFMPVILGIATGLMPCPSALAAYLTGLSIGGVAVGLKSVIYFGIGMMTSLIGLVTFFKFGGHKALSYVLKYKSLSPNNWSFIQGILFVAIGSLSLFFTH